MFVSRFAHLLHFTTHQLPPIGTKAIVHHKENAIYPLPHTQPSRHPGLNCSRSDSHIRHIMPLPLLNHNQTLLFKLHTLLQSKFCFWLPRRCSFIFYNSSSQVHFSLLILTYTCVLKTLQKCFFLSIIKMKKSKNNFLYSRCNLYQVDFFIIYFNIDFAILKQQWTRSWYLERIENMIWYFFLFLSVLA